MFEDIMMFTLQPVSVYIIIYYFSSGRVIVHHQNPKYKERQRKYKRVFVT